LFPAILGRAILPTRQEVYYFGVPQGSERYRPGRLPIWIDFGERIVYGTPDIDGLGFKLADDTRGEAFDPTNGDRTPSADAVASARRFLSERFPELAEAPLVEAQVCQYENSPDGHLIVDRHPDARNAWIVGGGSGHGFKLAPAVGEMVARAVVSGAALPSKFAFARLRTTEQRSTQFESDRRE
jgi:glycine/D-amino acid oxidase-like deaminating enzyme